MGSDDRDLLVICISVYCLTLFFLRLETDITEYLIDSTDKEWREQHEAIE